MAFMEWSDRYSVGVAEIDDEHQKLIAIINDLHENLAAGIDTLTLQRICDRLVEYTIFHFRHEEEHFAESAYPRAREHAAAHARMQRQVFEFRNQIRAKENSQLAVEMLHFLRGWLTQHIMIDDKNFGAYLIAKGAPAAAL